MKSLAEELRAINRREIAVAHMPGHKHRHDFDFDAYALDTTELATTDNLFQAEGILKRAQEDLSAIYSSDQSRFLVNGASVGLMATIMAFAKDAKVLVAYDSHKSIYNALALAGAEMIRVLPDYAFSHPLGYKADDYLRLISEDIRLIIITSPNYFGFTTDIRAIAEQAKRYQIPILVDEAHGAHLQFIKPEHSCLNQGANIVVQSTHKSLAALTQTAILHYKNLDEQNITKIDDYLEILQTSSPSYVLMSSIDLAVKSCYQQRAELSAKYHKMQEYIRANFADFLEEVQAEDGFKLWLTALKYGYQGSDLAGFLAEQGIYVELYNQYGVLVYLGVNSELEDLRQIKRALATLKPRAAIHLNALQKPTLAKRIEPVPELNVISLAVTEVKGYYIAENIIPYPTGVPLLLTGDYIDDDYYQRLVNALANKQTVLGIADKSFKTIRVYEKRE